MNYFKTLRCSTVGAQVATDTVPCILSLGPLSDVLCECKVGTGRSLLVKSINLISQPASSVDCITYCYGYDDLNCSCLAPVIEQSSSISCHCTVRSLRAIHTSLLTLQAEPSSSIHGVTKGTSASSDLSGFCPIQHTEETDLSCTVRIATRGAFSVKTVIPIFSTEDVLHCITVGEAHTTIRCECKTITHIDDHICFIHEAVEPDEGGNLSCIMCRSAGAPVETVFVQVSPGDRMINILNCIATPLPLPFSEVQCSVSSVVDGLPTYTMYRSGDLLIVNIYNLSHHVVESASLLQSTSNKASESITLDSRMWKIKFDTPEASTTRYMVSVKLKGISNSLLLSSLKGTISI